MLLYEHKFFFFKVSTQESDVIGICLTARLFQKNRSSLYYHQICQAWASQLALVVKNLPVNAGDIRDVGTMPGSGRSPEGGYGNELQYSCLENPMDRRAWRATVHRVAKSRTRLSNLACTHVSFRLLLIVFADAYCCITKVPSSFQFVRRFYHEWTLNFFSDSSASIDMTMWLFLSLLVR